MIFAAFALTIGCQFSVFIQRNSFPCWPIAVPHRSHHSSTLSRRSRSFVAVRFLWSTGIGVCGTVDRNGSVRFSMISNALFRSLHGRGDLTGSTAGLSSAGNTVAKSYKKVKANFSRSSPQSLADSLFVFVHSEELLHSQLSWVASVSLHSSVSREIVNFARYSDWTWLPFLIHRLDTFLLRPQIWRRR